MKQREVGGYVLVYKPNYKYAMQHSTNWAGWIYLHDYIVTKRLKRKLRKNEIVHHLDCNRKNNKSSNLIVLSRNDHFRTHHWINSGCKINVETHRCQHCNKPITSMDSKYFCSVECRAKASRKVERPTKLELKKLIKDHSWLALGRKFGVADNTVRKWAKKYGLL